MLIDFYANAAELNTLGTISISTEKKMIRRPLLDKPVPLFDNRPGQEIFEADGGALRLTRHSTRRSPHDQRFRKPSPQIQTLNP